MPLNLELAVAGMEIAYWISSLLEGILSDLPRKRRDSGKCDTDIESDLLLDLFS